MKQRLLLLLAFISGIAFLSSCDEFTFPGSGGDDFVLEKTDFTLPAIGGNVDVTFIPVTSWSAQCADSFVTISPSSGQASEKETTLLIKVAPNYEPVERVIKVLLSIADKDIVLTITQGANGSNEPQDPTDPIDPEDPEKPSKESTGSTENVKPGSDITAF